MIDNLAGKQKIRCAIYTRKSSEEGLEKEFNSLDAQRLSAENYIASQIGKGWVLVPTNYDDGGFSGGTMERPAFKRLLNDIREDKIDCIVVYKADRLSRRLFDFTKIIELLDKHKVSFISVTESFNTSTASGRLMFGMIMSFAQYERELTGERIRDKFDASCQKGMWMGGYIPIGYDLSERRLTINEDESKIIKTLFKNFIETGSVTDTFRELNDQGFRSKTWTSSSGKTRIGKRFNKSSVRSILTNYLYFGKINHKGDIHEGLHEAIIDEETWEKAQDLLKNKTPTISIPNGRITQVPLLKGIMDCGVCGSKMTPTYTNKGGRKYRYYICHAKFKGNNEQCQVGRIPANEAEELVIGQVLNILKKPEIIINTLRNSNDKVSEGDIIKSFKTINKVWEELFPVEQARIVNLLIKDVIISPTGMNINIYKQGLNTLSQELNG